MAHEAGIEFDLFDVAEIFKRTPYIADLKPGGKYVAKDMCEIGGVPLVLQDAARRRLPARRLHDRHRQDASRENLDDVNFNADQKVVYPVSNPLSPDRRRGRPEGHRSRPTARS